MVSVLARLLKRISYLILKMSLMIIQKWKVTRRNKKDKLNLKMLHFKNWCTPQQIPSLFNVITLLKSTLFIPVSLWEVRFLLQFYIFAFTLLLFLQVNIISFSHQKDGIPKSLMQLLFKNRNSLKAKNLKKYLNTHRFIMKIWMKEKLKYLIKEKHTRSRITFWHKRKHPKKRLQKWALKRGLNDHDFHSYKILNG